MPETANRPNPGFAALDDWLLSEGAHCGTMDEKKVTPPDNKQGCTGGAQLPDWSSGLRQLYNSVVEEPLPDAFAKLLEQLDSAGNG